MQRLDSTMVTLAHRQRSLPETVALEEARLGRTELETTRVVAQTRVDDLQQAQRKADADVEQVRQRRARNQQRLDAGSVSSPRELEQLQHEVGMLDARIDVLEDEELEVMEALEAAQTTLAAHEASAKDQDAALTDLEARRSQAVTTLEAEIAETGTERERTAEGLPEALLSIYRRLVQQMGGVGAAPLRRARCEGCRLELNGADLREIAATPSDVVLRCPECDRILVRTPESGL